MLTARDVYRLTTWQWLPRGQDEVFAFFDRNVHRVRDLLAAVKPARGVGVDFSPAMVEAARARHPACKAGCQSIRIPRSTAPT